MKSDIDSLIPSSMDSDYEEYRKYRKKYNLKPDTSKSFNMIAHLTESKADLSFIDFLYIRKKDFKN